MALLLKKPSAAFLVTLAALLAFFHAFLGTTGATDQSMTCDEIGYLTAGYTYAVRADYRLHPENGVLPQRWAALPITLARPPLPSTESQEWKTADVWKYGHAFFYGGALPATEFLFLGRCMIAVFSAATALLVFFWSRSLFGWRGGFLSLALFVFCPAFLAHGALATSDVIMTFFLLASVGAWWRHLENPGAGGAALSAVVLGLAFVTKFSAVLLPPMFLLVALVWAAGEARTKGWRSPLARIARTTVVHAGVTWAVIWAFYGFRYSAFAPDLAARATFLHGWDSLLGDFGWKAKIMVPLKEWHVLPEAWLYGLTFVLQFAETRAAFLSGEYSFTGWPGFFPFAFLIKTTLPLLLLLGAGLVAFASRIRRANAPDPWSRLRPLTPLAALFLIYWVTSLLSHLNIGHRHILPTYPVLFIAAGWLGRSLDLRRPILAALVGGLTLWHIGESFRARPHYLAYFNQVIGGSQNGWRHLVDSSLDWGQDLPGLKVWLDQRASGQKIYLAYFGAGDPAYEGIRATPLPSLPQLKKNLPWYSLTAGTYAVSATMLQHVYSTVRGDWTLALEQEFQKLRAIEPVFLAYQEDPQRRAALQREAPEEHWQKGWARYETLRFARLCYFLRVRKPEGSVGHSIFIHELSAREVAAATAGSLAEWKTLLERAAEPGAR